MPTSRLKRAEDRWSLAEDEHRDHARWRPLTRRETPRAAGVVACGTFPVRDAGQIGLTVMQKFSLRQMAFVPSTGVDSSRQKVCVSEAAEDASMDMCSDPVVQVVGSARMAPRVAAPMATLWQPQMLYAKAGVAGQDIRGSVRP
jgi:hypothetical protein